MLAVYEFTNGAVKPDSSKRDDVQAGRCEMAVSSMDRQQVMISSSLVDPSANGWCR